MVLHNVYDYDEALYPTVLGRADGLRSPRSIQLDPAYVSATVGAKGITQKLVAPGVFAGTIVGSSKGRPLPRTRLIEDFAASSALKVEPRTLRLFVPGDVLTIVAPYVRLNLVGTWANGDTATVTVSGQVLTYTVAGFTTLAAVATAIAAAINADYRLGTVRATAEGVYVHLYAVNMESAFSIAASENTAGNGTLTVEGSVTMAQRGVAIGTISAVDPLSNPGFLVLSANSAVRLPVGMPIGVASSSPVDLGMLSPQWPLDLLWRANQYYGLYTSAVVIRERLPYWDGQLSRLFPEIQPE